MDKKEIKVAAATLGCKVNYYDTQAVLSLFSERGYSIVDFSEKADIYIINTCTVTNVGDKKSRQTIRRAATQNPKAFICVTGCYAQIAPEETEKIDGVSLVTGVKDRSKLIDLVENGFFNEGDSPIQKNRVFEISGEKDYEYLKISKMEGRQRAYLKIQDGCDMFCSYCAIPYARGRVRSRQEHDIYDEARRFAENGVKEIVLTGIHAASYGKDFKDKKITLADIIEGCHKTDKIERIRLSSLEPTLIDENFINRIKSLKKLCRHFHLSLQSGCDKTLKAMNRKYDSATFEKSVNILRENIDGVSVTTDMIAGFPGETNADFYESLKFAEKIGFSKIHIFPYSVKRGTLAAKMPGRLDKKTKSERAALLAEVAAVSQKAFMTRFIGKSLPVLFEKEISPGLFEGFSDNYILVNKKGGGIINEIIDSVPDKFFPGVSGGEPLLYCE